MNSMHQRGGCTNLTGAREAGKHAGFRRSAAGRAMMWITSKLGKEHGDLLTSRHGIIWESYGNLMGILWAYVDRLDS